jgi:hypothetical protein
MENWWKDTDGGKKKYSEQNLYPLPLCPPKILNGLAWD